MFDPLRSFEKVTIEFDRDCKVAKAKLESLDLAEKVEGLQLLQELFSSCKTFSEQLYLFKTKTHNILKGALLDLSNFKAKKDDQNLYKFMMNLKEFMLCLICDAYY